MYIHMYVYIHIHTYIVATQRRPKVYAAAIGTPELWTGESAL